jgi:hypothetical protein
MLVVILKATCSVRKKPTGKERSRHASTRLLQGDVG